MKFPYFFCHGIRISSPLVCAPQRPREEAYMNAARSFFAWARGVFTVGSNSSNQFKCNDLFMSNLSGVRLNKSHR